MLKLANVTTNPCLMWQHYISYVHNYYGPYAYCSLDKGVAYTRGGGGKQLYGAGFSSPECWFASHFQITSQCYTIAQAQNALIALIPGASARFNLNSK